jgi:Ca-activated chloride channel family protein
MATADVPWAPGSPPVPRLEAARRSFKLFVAGGDAPDGTHFDPRPSDQIGLVTFALLPQTACPLTLNHSVLLKVADEQEPKAGLDAGTNVGDAIAEAVIRLDAAGHRKKVAILLSDGEHNVSKEGPDDALKPRPAAQLAANLGIKVYTIDAGGDPNPTAPVEERQQRETGREALRAVAALTGGRSFAATSGTELLAAYKEIAALEKTEVESFVYRRYFEFYPWCAAAAVVLLLAAHVLDRSRWRVVP